MQNFNWQLDNFALGMHTEPAKTQGGERYAAEIQNLRIDSDGWLRERSEIMAVGSPNAQNITGIAATPKNIFVLRADGKLYIRERDDLDTETEITGVSDLDGRISVVDFNTYVIITSEGTDQGHLIDLREGEDYAGYTLGLDPPTDAALVSASPGIYGQLEGVPAGFYQYKITYVRLYDPLHTVVAPDQDDPFLDMESNANLGTSATVTEAQNAVTITIEHSSNLLVTGVRVYRNGGGSSEIYRLVKNVRFLSTDTRPGYRPKSGVNLIDIATEEEWAEGRQLRGDNDRIPAEVKQIFKYNDLIFAPAEDRLIYSDIQFGSLVPWAYPAVNEIRTGEQVTFCAELREVLLFGGRGRLSRLTGTDEYNFNIDTLSHRGPLDGYSWNRLTEVLAYIGEGGFFVTDASSVKPLSDPSLNRIFKDRKLLTGSLVFLQDGDILFDFETPDGHFQYKLEDGAWARWTDINIVQAATIIEKVSDVDQATLVLIADGTGQLKELNWNSTEGADAADWHWESNIISGLRDGVANKFKRFRELEWTGQADGDITLEVFNADDLDTALSTKTFDSRDSLRPVRIPINRKMRRMIFRVSGTGTVKLQGLRLEMQV